MIDLKQELPCTMTDEQARTEIEHYAELDEMLKMPVGGTAVEIAMEERQQAEINGVMLDAFTDMLPRFEGKVPLAHQLRDDTCFKTYDHREARHLQASTFWLLGFAGRYYPNFLIGRKPSQYKGLADFLFKGATLEGVNIGGGVIGSKRQPVEALTANSEHINMQLAEARSKIGVDFARDEIESGAGTRMLNVQTGELTIDQTVAGAMAIRGVRNAKYHSGISNAIYARKMRRSRPKDGLVRAIDKGERYLKPKNSDLVEYGVLLHMVNLAAYHEITDDLSELLKAR